MKIYLIRHGNNTKDTYQNDVGDLNPIGIEQANRSGKFLKTINPDIIIASTYMRTMQTANEINKYLNQKLIFSNLFTEIKLPTSMLGKNDSHEDVININKAIKENFHSNDWHHSDEENFQDVKIRATHAINELIQRDEDKILVVSHAGFIKRFVAVFAFGQDISSQDFKKFMSVFTMANCGITQLNISPDGFCSVVTWNNISHLEELVTY